MRFGRARSAAGEAAAAEGRTDSSDDSQRPFELAATDLITVDGRRLGWIATDGERTSDWLNRNEQIVVHGLTEIALTDELTETAMPGAGVGGPSRLDRSALMFVVPPPLPPNRHLRLHRRRVQITLEMGRYEVGGQLHVRPGADAGDHVLRGARSMVPLTDVELIHRGDPEFRRTLAVLIVNTAYVTRMVGVTRHVSQNVPPTPAPVPSARVPSAAPDPMPSGPVEQMSALQILLDAGLLSILEFQEKRAELVRRQPPG